MEGREVDLLGIYQLIVGRCAHVFNVIDKEGVGRGVMGEEDDLSSTSREFFDDFGTDT